MEQINSNALFLLKKKNIKKTTFSIVCTLYLAVIWFHTKCGYVFVDMARHQKTNQNSSSCDA